MTNLTTESHAVKFSAGNFCLNLAQVYARFSFHKFIP